METATINKRKTDSSVELHLLEFAENEVTIIYAPALDVTGYGNTVKEAKASFEISLNEFLSYTTENATLETTLTQLGWTFVNDSQPIPPKQIDLISISETFNDIVNNKNYKSYKQTVSF